MRVPRDRVRKLRPAMARFCSASRASASCSTLIARSLSVRIALRSLLRHQHRDNSCEDESFDRRAFPAVRTAQGFRNADAPACPRVRLAVRSYVAGEGQEAFDQPPLWVARSWEICRS